MEARRCTLDAYVFDALMRDLVGHDRRASVFLVYAALAALAQDGRPRLSHAQLAERTGLSKRAVQEAVRHLVDRGLLHAVRGGGVDVASYEPLSPWRRRAEASA